MKLLRFACALAMVVAISPASAAILVAEGNITNIAALRNGVPTAVPTGSISVGDPYKLTATFDLATAQVAALFDADPSINIYYLPGSSVSLRLGSFSTTFHPTFDFNSSLQIWDNRVVGGPTDAQSFSFFRFLAPPAEVPFAMGPGAVSYSVNQNNFDFTATARSNDLISPLAPLSSFASRTFEVGFLNADTNLFVFVQGSIPRASVVAVPEPATWAFMVVGFGAMGAAMRRRKHTLKLSTTWSRQRFVLERKAPVSAA